MADTPKTLRVPDAARTTTAELANPRGFEELEALGQRGSLQQVLLGLREPGQLLELTGDRVSLLSVEPAPDGELALQISGKVVLRGGRLVAVVGTPNAAAAINPEG